MVKMRIPIREQLGCLVLLASLIGLAVIAVATWITNHSFVLSIRATRLSLTASLKSAQVASNLLLMQSTVKGTSTRVLIQSALQRYNGGNNTSKNWERSLQDLQAVFQGDQTATFLVQAQVYAANNSDYSVLNSTAPAFANIPLPYLKPDGQNATLGEDFIPELYPHFSPIEIPYNSSFNQTIAIFNGRIIDGNNYLFSGPYRVNSTLSLMSITMPIINNTSSIDTLGWLTAMLDAKLVTDIVDALEGLDDTGMTMIFAPNNSTNKFPSGTIGGADNQTVPQTEFVRFLIAPTNRNAVKSRHSDFNNITSPLPFDWNKFPAIKKGYTQITDASNNAGSIISTKNEAGHNVAVGYALISNPFVDWILVVEQSHSEVWAPIYHLRSIIVACVFGTMGGILVLAFPVAHFLSRPIRRLRDATEKSVAPPGFEDDSLHSQHDGADDDHAEELARKEGWFGQVKKFGRRPKKTRVERREEERRRQFRIPGKVKDRKHFIHDELTDLTKTFNEMTDELMMQYEKLEERVQQRTAELEQSKKAAEAANESKTLFIANISHELKTPLNGILGMTAVCMSEDDPVKIKRSLGIIYKSGDLLLNLLTDLLTFSKNQVGQQLSLDEKEFRLRDISSQVLAIFERQAKDGGIDLKVKFEGPYDANVEESGRPNERSDLAPFGLGRLKDMILYGDQHRILQVVINLVSNSLKFTPKGRSVLITIRCLGEASMTDSRKGSLKSRQSSTRNSKTRGRASSSEVGAVSVMTPNQFDTANAINAFDKAAAYSHVFAQERTSTPPPGRWLSFEFEVEDTGPGIPDNLHDKIFEPFVQGDLGLSKKYGGTGLGLSICSQLAGLMKGTMRMRSEVGHGSVFTMDIPLRHITSRPDSTASSSNINPGPEEGAGRHSLSTDEPRHRQTMNDDALSGRSIQSATSNAVGVTTSTGPVAFDTDAKPRLVGLSQPFFASNPPLESPNSQSAAMERVTAEATQRGDKVKVLVAEDNKTNQEVVLRMLKLEDVYDVTVAKDGQEALDKVKESMERQTPYNLIFMDVQMPNLDGLQSTRLIRQSGFSAPIVALTAYSEESNIRECYDCGMNFFLSKPIRRPALKHVLRTYCPPIPEEEGEATTPPPIAEASSSKPNGRAKQPQTSIPGPVNSTIVPRTRDDLGTPNISPLS
ncbi:uncharacterized protein BDR25DRAFT_224634 [Lindgomyces ingoldianus]|uniref:Uncharacterized protein n=1 Tax=Lindgomyces ingoldianus TaxID=673940 RepID=A0ACB6QVL3_9PLEO|nr:uncharacterized protein BDR25DRAFT_224634 [Lindgomyces ingoldianus]KAF2471043.1 hypothetical protein BDR25DRAFT_224634 [Lindgomyces ingoldianus]